MAMGKRTSKQAPMFDGAGFDRFAEEQCQRFYAPVMGRRSLPPGRYFRLLLVGYFGGLDSERGMAWRAADSLARACAPGAIAAARPGAQPSLPTAAELEEILAG